MLPITAPTPGPRDAAGGGPDPRVAQEIDDALTQHLLASRPTADLGQGAVALLTVAAFWNSVPWWAALGWFALVLGTAFLRGANRRQAAERLGGVELRDLVRRDVWISASLWGGWALLVSGSPVLDLAILLIIVAGLVAAATSTLVADRSAYMGFMVLTMVPLGLSVVMSGLDRSHVTLLLLMAVYAPFMASVHRRTHGLLIEQMRSTARLRISEEDTGRHRDFLNALFASAPSLIVVTDQEGRVSRANPAFERVLGHRLQDVEGEPLVDLLSLPDNRAALADLFTSVSEGGRKVDEIQLLHRDGHTVWVRLSGTSARGMAEGAIIFVGEDVTAQVEARHAQDLARGAAEETARAKSAFLASTSHEIRTPLNGILGMIELLLDTGLTPHQRQSAEIVRASGQGLLRILNDVLDVSKMEAGQLDLEIIDFDVTDLVGGVVRMFSASAAGRNVELLVDVTADVPRFAHGDPVRLRQVLSNLVANAVKFTEQGEVVVSVRRDGDEDDSGIPLRFAVRDTGIGIAPEKHGLIFEEFEQADTSTTRTHGGTGLGLTISKRLVEIMGGTISVRSRPSEGSEFAFVVSLPEAHRAPGGKRRTPTVDLTGLRVLVVDDNATARRIVREALLGTGVAEVVETDNVDEGLATLAGAPAEARFDAVILDHMMPKKDGFHFARAVADDPSLAASPILMLTSAGDVAAGREAREVGIGGYLTKPVSRLELYAALRQLLGQRREDGPERRIVTRESLVWNTPLRILLAEDNPVNQQVAVTLLTKRGHTVTAVTDGRQAVEAALGQAFDIVLMDIQMPGVDGLQAAREIRAAGLHDLPIVALTAHAFAEERERCQRAGMNDFLSKPFRPEDLYALVDRWTGAKGAG